jgi:hypothetical protein
MVETTNPDRGALYGFRARGYRHLQPSCRAHAVSVALACCFSSSPLRFSWRRLRGRPGSSSTKWRAAIADKLFISDCNLRNDVTSIYNKLGLANRLELLV